MRYQPTIEFILRIFKIFDGFDGPDSGQLFWRTNEKFAPLSIACNCNDVFHWATSDLEEITPENIIILEQCFEDIKSIDGQFGYYTPALFAARLRRMRPQGAYYQGMPEEIAKLFDSCGPSRKVELGNPVDQERFL